MKDCELCGHDAYKGLNHDVRVNVFIAFDWKCNIQHQMFAAHVEYFSLFVCQKRQEAKGTLHKLF